MAAFASGGPSIAPTAEPTITMAAFESGVPTPGGSHSAAGRNRPGFSFEESSAGTTDTGDVQV
jgi:hypothetical protein